MVIGIVLTTCCLMLVGAMMQNAVVVRSDSSLEAPKITAPEISVPMCKDLGVLSADYRGCTLLVDETERRIIEQVFIGEYPARVVHDVYLYGSGWGPRACYFSGPIAAGPYIVYEVPCDQQPMRWASP